jgi:ectoine hydroxylase-related dioxygenase (phytanoyl-CoA dioxygenase family)
VDNWDMVTRMSEAEFARQIEHEGSAVVEGVFGTRELEPLRKALLKLDVPRSRAGIRHVMSQAQVSEVAHSPAMRALAMSVLGQNAFPFRATFFDKSPNSNWLVAWHQDTALPLREKHETSDWGPWSVKDGVIYAHAPARALMHVLALRLHLDDSNADNGPLKVLPGTQNRGVFTDDEIHKLAEEVPAAECCVGTGGVVAMRPLVVHASSKCISNQPRRVLHIEYAAFPSFDGGLTLAIA